MIEYAAPAIGALLVGLFAYRIIRDPDVKLDVYSLILLFTAIGLMSPAAVERVVTIFKQIGPILKDLITP